MNIVRTKTPSGEPIVIVPEAEFDRLRALAEDAEDAAVVARSKAALADGTEELLTFEEAAALRIARTPLAFWRSKRNLSLDTLAERIGVSRSLLAEVEDGQRTENLHLYRELAAALRVTIDDLVPEPSP